ncbi:hypothetical protein [Paenibacillus hexagrammi]|uniref:Uncharacterized protein n=1 Tax=Paenibacillus hexagrammi TaxID=2908839 RepID=A0ABY3SH82_9BACL|nr:hypothetical protein [Paenibacillus sp. YPD9-1]UJF33398.1 hypothetical protein L0M14_28475 [Paenibacillus sp. YPD9-1]
MLIWEANESDNPLFSTIAVIDMGIRFEKASIEWCSSILDLFREKLAGKAGT